MNNVQKEEEFHIIDSKHVGVWFRIDKHKKTDIFLLTRAIDIPHKEYVVQYLGIKYTSNNHLTPNIFTMST